MYIHSIFILIWASLLTVDPILVILCRCCSVFNLALQWNNVFQSSCFIMTKKDETPKGMLDIEPDILSIRKISHFP